MTAGNGYAAGAGAFLIGAMLGAGTALLMAPQSGARTRRQIRYYAECAAEDMLDKGKEFVDTLDTAIGVGKKFVKAARFV